MQRNRFWDVASDVKGWGISSWSFSVTLVCDSWIYRSSFSFFTLGFLCFEMIMILYKAPFSKTALLSNYRILWYFNLNNKFKKKRQQLFSMMPVFSLLRVTRCFHIWISWSQLHVCLLDTFSYLPESYYYSHSLLQVQEKKKKEKRERVLGFSNVICSRWLCLISYTRLISN